MIYFSHYAWKALMLIDEVEIIINNYCTYIHRYIFFVVIFHYFIIFNDSIKFTTYEKLLKAISTYIIYIS